MRIKNTILMLLAIGICMSSCQKDDDNVMEIEEPQTLSEQRSDILIANSWKITDITQTRNTSGMTTTLGFNELVEPCDLDDVYTFRTNGIFIYDAGSDKCSTSDFAFSLTWEINEAGTILLIDAQGEEPINADLSTMTETSFQIIEIFEEVGLREETVTTYTAQ